MASDDLLEYLKLEADFLHDYTIHRSSKRNRATGALEEVEVKWRRTKSLGESVFGQVWHEQNYLPNGIERARAVKVIRKDRMQKLQIDYGKELLALATFSKEEYRQADVLVSFLNWFENDDSVFLAMEYFQHGDLAKHILSISSEDEVRQITTDLLEGLKIMHGENFAHRDLKPQNIFVVEKPPQSARWWVKIGDFGISKRVKNDETAFRTPAGTPHFQAPEIHGFIDYDEETSGYNKSVDIWSLGCVVYNISSQTIPFRKMSDINSFCQRRSQLQREPLSHMLSQAGIEFIEILLVPEPARRMTVSQVLQHSWVRNASPPLPPPSAESEPVMNNSLKSSGEEPREMPVAHRSKSIQDHPENFVMPVRKRDSGSSLTTQALSILIAEANHTMVLRDPLRLNPINASASKSELAITSTLGPDNSGGVYRQPRKTLNGLTSRDEGRSLSQLFTSLSMIAENMDLVLHPVITPSELIGRSDIHWDESTVLATCAVRSVAFSPDGTLLASGLDNGTVQVWSVTIGNPSIGLQGHRNPITCVTFSPDGTLLASSSDDGMVRLWSVATGETRHELSGYGGSIYGLAFSPDGTLLASAGATDTIRLWNVVTGQVEDDMSGHENWVMGFWDVANRWVKHKFRRHGGFVYGISFSPDGTLLASCSYDRAIRLWDVATRKIQRELLGHRDLVRRLDFSPDGTILASGGDDQKVQLWEVATGRALRTLSDEGSPVLGVAFSPKGTHFASCSLSGRILLWGDLPTLTGAKSKWPESLRKSRQLRS